MIDLHTHILPALDDGSPDMEESLRLARRAVDDGISTVIATPHHANGVYHNEADAVIYTTAALKKELVKQNIPLTVRAGMEIRVYPKLLEDFESGKLLTLADSSYMLLEFPGDRVPSMIEHFIHELALLRITPVIAHPERNEELVRNPDRLRELVLMGAFAQVTAHSINGRFGRKIKRVSIEMCQRNLVHFIASDMHNGGSRDYGLREAFDTVSSCLGPEYTSYYQKNAKLLLDSEPLDIWKPEKSAVAWYRFF